MNGRKQMLKKTVKNEFAICQKKKFEFDFCQVVTIYELHKFLFGNLGGGFGTLGR